MILLGMSVFDSSSSLAWMVSTLALPGYDNDRESESAVYGAKGNDQTCKAQGFFLELGFVGSTAFTACLTTFYVLTIIYGYREQKMKPLRKYFVAIPAVLALALASAAIPYYRPFYVACFVSNPNSEVDRYADEWIYLIMFVILPVGIAIVISVSNMVAILLFVSKQTRRANRWRFGRFGGDTSSGTTSNSFPSRRSSRLSGSKTEAAVFWQAFWYVMAFLLTWVIYLIGQFKPYFSTSDDALYAFWILLLVLNPLIGFWNCFVYAKPWTWNWNQNQRTHQDRCGRFWTHIFGCGSRSTPETNDTDPQNPSMATADLTKQHSSTIRNDEIDFGLVILEDKKEERSKDRVSEEETSPKDDSLAHDASETVDDDYGLVILEESNHSSSHNDEAHAARDLENDEGETKVGESRVREREQESFVQEPH